MKNVLKILFIISLAACGKVPDNTGSPSSGTSSAGDSKSNVASDDASRTTNITAKLYATEADLPICDLLTAKELVYVKDTAQFFYCDTSWTPIDLKGAKGDVGAQGVAGADGKDGVNGKDGTNAQTVLPYVWVDPIDNSRWFIGASQTEIQSGGNAYGDQTAPDYLCPTGSRSPTVSEYQAAFSAGLVNFFHTLYPIVAGFILGVGPLKNSFVSGGVTYGNYNVIEGQLNGLVNPSFDFSNLASNTSLPSLCRIN